MKNLRNKTVDWIVYHFNTIRRRSTLCNLRPKDFNLTPRGCELRFTTSNELAA
jgi:hypothetical protein